MLPELTARIRSGSVLTPDESASALDRMLAEDGPEIEIREFLVALSERGEVAEEVAGFARVLRERAIPVRSSHDVFVDTAGTGGGLDTFNISTAAAFVIAGTGLAVAKHGNRAVTSQSGSADVLTELGLRIDQSAEVVERALEELGICFIFAPRFHPALKRVATIRRQLGRRTIFNLVGPLANPAGAPCQLIGVYDTDTTGLLAQALRILGCRRAWVVHSEDGLDEISCQRPTRVAEVMGHTVREFRLEPPRRAEGLPPSGKPRHNASLIRSILDGTMHGAAREIVLVNAAAARHIALEEPLEEALERAEEAIDSRSALGKLEQLVEAYSR